MCIISRVEAPQPSTTVNMNQEEDEDAFLYGEQDKAAAAGPASADPPRVDHEMEPASEEGEVDYDEEDESDSVRSS